MWVIFAVSMSIMAIALFAAHRARWRVPPPANVIDYRTALKRLRRKARAMRGKPRPGFPGPSRCGR